MKNLAAARRFGYGTNANSFINPNAVEQIVGREPRERVSQEAFVNQSWRYRAAASTLPLGGPITISFCGAAQTNAAAPVRSDVAFVGQP